MASIFISYRRDDAGGHAGRLCDRLTTRFGDDRIFMDIEDIQPGQHFVRSIEQTIGACDVVVAVIGPRWLEMLSERAQEAEDFVRHEIGIALARNITVIPVLVGGADLPPSDQLPAELSELSRRQAIEIRDDMPGAGRVPRGRARRREPWGVWGGQLFLNGRILANKRRRGRPPKVPRPEDQLPEVPIPEHLLGQLRTA